MKPARIQPSDVLDWLIACIGECEADGYQQQEKSQQSWYVNGPPEVYAATKNKMIATCGDQDFLVRITRLKARSH